MSDSSVLHFPLSPLQRGLWLTGAPAEQGLGAAFRVLGPLDEAALRAALASVVTRHEILRTTFVQRAGLRLPLQAVAPRAEVEWWPSPKTVGSGTATPLEALEELLALPFDLERGPLLRARLATTPDGERSLCLAASALILDRQSLRQLLRDLLLELANPLAEPEEPLQYASYGAWLSELATADDEESQRARAHWSRQPTTAPAPPAWGRPSEHLDQGSVTLSLEPNLYGRLRQRARELETSPDRLGLLGWLLLLARVTESPTPAVRVELDGRSFADLETGLGVFARSVPIALATRTEASVVDLLAKLEEALRLGAELLELAPWPDPGADPRGVAPLELPCSFTTAAEPDPVEAGGLVAELVAEASTLPPIALALELTLGTHRATARLSFDPTRYGTAECELLLAHWSTLLGELLAAPTRRAASLALVAGPERSWLEASLRDAEPLPAAAPATVAAAFAARAAAHPDRTALVFEGDRVSYGELQRLARRVSEALSEQGLSSEARVGVLLGRSHQLVIALLGVLEAGCAYVPLEPSLPASRLEALVNEARLGALITEEGLARAVRLPAGCPELVLEHALAQARSTPAAPPLPSPAEALAYVLFTSGSTGPPKGVAIEQRQILSYARGFLHRAELPETASYGLVSTFAADLGNTMIYPALLSGGCLHVLAEELGKDPGALGDYMSRCCIDALKIVPSHLAAMISGAEPTALLPRRCLVLGGEASSWELVETLRTLAPGCRVLNHYGPTETTVGVTLFDTRSARPEPSEASVPLGSPFAGARLEVVDAAGHWLPRGVPGELRIAGPGVARGYLFRPATTAERFLPDASGSTPGGRCYRTGDRVRVRPDGRLEFLGRFDHQVKLRGHRIELAEIEGCLTRLPEVREARVELQEDRKGEPRLVAYVLARPGRTPSAEALRSALAAQLPAVMVPAAFVELTAWPLTPNGKIDRRALPRPEDRPAGSGRDETAPRNATEEVLADLFAEVLGLERVGVESSFFALGGDSILVIRVVAAAHRKGLRLQPAQLFETPTVAGLAARVQQPAHLEEISDPTRRALADEPTATSPLSPIQRWFFELDLAFPHHWNQAALWEVGATGLRQPFARIARALLEHHEALLSCFPLVEGARRQLCRPPASWRESFAVLDLGALDPRHEIEVLGALSARAQASLDLDRGPLARILVFERPAAPDALLLLAHHLVVDVVSWQILIDDLALAWPAAQAGAAIALPAPSTRFAEWARRLDELGHAGSFELDAEAWPRAVPVGPAATSPPRPMRVGDQLPLRVELDEAATAALEQRTLPAYAARMDEALLAAFALAWHQILEPSGLWIDLEGHGREAVFEDVDLSRTVGWFTTHTPLWLPPTDGTIAQTLLEAKERWRRLPRRGFSFGVLRHLGPTTEAKAALRQLPAPAVKLNFLGRSRSTGGDGGHAPGSLRPLPCGPGPLRHLEDQPSHALVLEAALRAGRLEIELRYSPERFAAHRMEQLAEAWIRNLEALAALGDQPAAGGRSPVDFPLAKLSASELDGLLHRLEAATAPTQRPAEGGRFGFLEDLYPASPLQQALLAHAAVMPGSTVGFEQKSLTLEGSFDVEAFARALELLCERHTILRTGFVWEGLTAPLQVVYRHLPPALEVLDWRAPSATALPDRLASWLAADRQRGFAPTQPPLVRWTVLQLGPERTQIVWSYSHLLFDAWCRDLLLGEILRAYDAFARGEQPRLPPITARFRDYIAWLDRQDHRAAESYWRAALAGVAQAPLLWLDTVGTRRLETPTQGVWQETMPPEASAALAEAARRAGVTLATLVHAAWALTLMRLAGRSEVTFGITTSGRPADLPGAEAILGMLANNLPRRIRRTDDARLEAWLRELQAELGRAQQNGWCAADDIQSWSGLAPGQRLYETLVVVQNVPLGTEPTQGEGALRLIGYASRLETGLPLTLVVGPFEPIQVRLFHDGRLYDAHAAGVLGQAFLAYLRGLTCSLETPLGRLAPIGLPFAPTWRGPAFAGEPGPLDASAACLLRDDLGLGPARGLWLDHELPAGLRDRLAGLARSLAAPVEPLPAAGVDGQPLDVEELQGPRLLACGPARAVALARSQQAPSGLDLCVFGPPPAVGLARALLARFKSVHSLYVPTRLGWPVAIAALRAEVPIPTLGRPAAGLALTLLDGQDVVLPGAPGELTVIDAGGTRFRTGDWARALPSGELELLGPATGPGDDRLKLGLVEAALRRDENTLDVAVRPWVDASGATAPVAYRVPRGGAATDARGLAAALYRRLPREWVPLRYVELEQMPSDEDGLLVRERLPEPTGRPDQEAFEAPRTPLEVLLVGIWERLFELRPIGIRDSFFSLGGHSLLALRMLRELPPALGERLSLSTLLSAATIEELAHHLESERLRQPWSPLVRLQRAGQRPPLVFVHALGGEVLCYRDLSEALGHDQPFFALEARGWSDGPPDESVETMAASYLEHVLAVRPEGPYLLFGWSFGGLVALEMAQQLRASGREVGFLGILDTNLQASEHSGPSELDQRIRELEDRHPNASLEELWRVVTTDAALAADFAAFKRHYRLPAGLDLHTFLRYDRTAKTLGQCRERYRARPYGGPITLFRALEGHVRRSSDPTLGWSALAPRYLEIVDVPGTHDAMVYPPHATALAKAIRTALAQARSARENNGRLVEPRQLER